MQNKLKNIEFITYGKIKIAKRVSENESLFFYKRVPILQNQYKPASATYTGVTVGGITTGGWDIKDAHYSAKAVGMSDRYHLYCKTGTDKKDVQIISEIHLLPADAEIARKNTALSQFLQGNKLVLKHNLNPNSTNMQVAKTVYEGSGNMNLVENVMAKDLANVNLTLGEVSAVIKFLSGGN